MTARRAGGFAYIAAIVFLVVLAGFALAALRLSGSAQVTVDQAVLGAGGGPRGRAGGRRGGDRPNNPARPRPTAARRRARDSNGRSSASRPRTPTALP